MPYFLIIFISISLIIEGVDLGTFGTTFPIAEEDLLEVLQERLFLAEVDEKKKQEVLNTFIKTIQEPKGRLLPRAVTAKKYEFDPTFILKDDVKDEQGKLLIPKGTKVNPLDKTPLSEILLFVDGFDLEQIAWVKNQKGKVILTRGRPLDLEDKEKRAIYFDQSGYLTLKLGIQALPARVLQEGKKLKVEEISCI